MMVRLLLIPPVLMLCLGLVNVARGDTFSEAAAQFEADLAADLASKQAELDSLKSSSAAQAADILALQSAIAALEARLALLEGNEPPPPEPEPTPTPGGIVKVAPAICLDTYSNIVTVTDGTINSYSYNPPPDTALDFRGVRVEFQPPVNGWNPSGSDNVCLVGGQWIGQADRSMEWQQNKKTWDGSAVRVAHLVGQFIYENVQIDNSHDGIMLPRTPDLPDTAEGIVRGSIVLYNRDDCIESDGQAAVTVDDSYFECNMFFSMRNKNTGGKNGSHSHLVVRNSLIYLKCMPDDRTSVAQCPGSQDAVGQLLKLGASSEGLPIHFKDVIIRVDSVSKNGSSAMAFNQYGNATYDNVTVVWLGDGPWPGPDMPAGVTVTTDMSVWNDNRNAWFAAHGCDPTGHNCFGT